MKKRTRKGFTVTELVIVMVVIAVLAALLIPFIANLLKKNRIGNDSELIRNLNKSLKADQRAHNTMTDALAAAEAFGYEVGKINASEVGNEILYDIANDVFCYYDGKENTIKYIPGTEISVRLDKGSNKYWRIITSKNVDDAFKTDANGITTLACGMKDMNWSCYLATTPKGVDTVYAATGVDVGRTVAINLINYENTKAQEAIIRTNGGDLKVTAPNDRIDHYGNAKYVSLITVSTNSYFEHGKVLILDITNGRLVMTADEGSIVEAIYLAATDDKYNEIFLATQDGAEIPLIITREHVSIPKEGLKLVATVQTNVDKLGNNAEKVEKIYLYPATDVKEETLGFKVTDLSLLIVEALSGEGRAQAQADIHDAGIFSRVADSKVKTIDETKKTVDVIKNIKAYVTDVPNVGGITFGLYFNDNIAKIATLQRAATFNAFAPEDQAFIDTFIYATEDGNAIFTDHIEDYANEEKIAKALAVVKNNYGEAAAARVEELLNVRREYFTWLADYEVSFDGDIEVGTVALGGHYSTFADNFWDGAWFGFGLSDMEETGTPVTLKAGDSVRLLDTAYKYAENLIGHANEDLHMNFAAICGYVKSFSCGVSNLSAANTGKTITVRLFLYETDENGVETGNKVECASISYVLEAPVKPE